MIKSRVTNPAHSTPQTSRSIESHAIYGSGIAFIIAFVASLFYFSGDPAPLFGRDSIGVAASILGTVSAFIIYFAAAYRVRIHHAHLRFLQRARLYLTTTALAFVHAAVGILLIAGSFYIIADAFVGLHLDSYASSTIVAIVAAITGYITYLSASRMTSERVSTVLAAFLVSGALTSMITAEDPNWWNYHFSSLGASGSLSAYAFNLTLIIAGIVIVSLSDYVAEDFALLKNKSTVYKNMRSNAIRIALACIGVFLALVGVFAYDSYPIIHNSAAGGMAVIFVGLIVILPLLAPSFPKAFFGLSYALMAVIVFCYWLWQGIGYFNLTTFELLAAAIIFSWLVVFIRQIAAALADEKANAK